jgi:hypothetical protein
MKHPLLIPTIVALALAMGVPRPLQGKPYRGAEYRTIGTMKYGRFEVRMRSAQVSGMLSSFFTYYDPANPWNEIDIESMGRYSGEIQFNTIVPTQGDNHVQRQPLWFNPHAAFHVYAIEWTPDYVAWKADGVEVYRQTGSHIGQLIEPQKLMMNVWQPSDVNWAGTFNPAKLPVYAYYDWVKYYAYTPGVGDNFTLQWMDEFNTFDPTRWQKATHTWDGNNCQFVQENAVLNGGYLILCITDSAHSGYSGGQVEDTDTEPPHLISARASTEHVRVLFSEPVERTSAQTSGNYVIPGSTVQGASLFPGGRSVDLAVSGLNFSQSQILIVTAVRDTSENVMGTQSTGVIVPLHLPVRINVGGGSVAGYLGDTVWTYAAQFGGIGGSAVQAPSTLDIKGTTEDSIYRSALEGLTFYQVRVPTDITLVIDLLFAEPKYQEAGKRVFDVTMNGTQTAHIDLVQLAGYGTAWNVEFKGIQAADGMISLYFSPVLDSPILCGIVIQSMVEGIGENTTEEGSPAPEFSVFPNPTNGGANFSFSISRSEDVAIEIFDLLGRRVLTMPLGRRERGQQTVRWDTDNLASGVYVCSLITGGPILSTRLLLIK